MKRAGQVFDQIWTRNNLARAFWRAAAGKRHLPEVCRLGRRLDEELAIIGRQLRAGRYEFSPYREFLVQDTKTRVIHAPVFRDRVVHHAMITAAGTILEKGALVHSYACRIGRGQHAALRQAREWSKRSDWYGKMDVEKFYDSVDHATLSDLLERRFREARLLQLFERLLASYTSTLAEPGNARGLPIGALTSQYLGNFLLDEFDRRMKATGLVPRYLRYMDDTVVWGKAEPLREAREHAHAILGALDLRLKHGGEWNRCSSGLPFLGFVIYPDRIRLNKMGRKRLRRKLKELEQEWNAGVLSENDRAERGSSLFAHAAIGDDVSWRRTILSMRRFGEEPEGQARDPRRLVEQFREELPLGSAEQEPSWQPQQEPGLPRLPGSRNGGENSPPDDALSRSRAVRDETRGKSSPGFDICPRAKKKSGGAPTDSKQP